MLNKTKHIEKNKKFLVEKEMGRNEKRTGEKGKFRE
jgi:hypothetical protein